MIILLMGIAGAGKTTIGEKLATELAWPFYDADQFHPPANIERMSAGIPLADADRAPWLDAIRAAIQEYLSRGESAIFAASALKQEYRDRLLGDHPNVHLVYLKGDYTMISERFAHRKGHFMPSELLGSQFDTLEEPGDALVMSIDQTPEEIVAGIRQALSV